MLTCKDSFENAICTIILNSVLIPAMTLPPFSLGKDFEDDLQFLLQGVSEFQVPSNLTASEVLVHGSLAFPIATTDDGRAFLAGGYYGQGRVIVATHEGFLGLGVN